MASGAGPWTEKFFPRQWSEFIGNSEAVKKAQLWAKNWNAGKKQKPLLLYGSPGNGKTTLALLTARLSGWSVFELNASDFRTKDLIEKFAGAASQGASFSGKPRLILLDEVDGLQAADRGGAGAISKILRETKNPVILTANSIYGNQKLAPIRAQCDLVQLKKINYLSIAKRLREILALEGIEFDKEAIELLAKNSAGDLRSALLDTQTLAMTGCISTNDVESLGYREREENVFSTLRSLFRAKTFEEARRARFGSEVDSDLLVRWVEENIPNEFDSMDTARAFDFFSRGDIFEGRVFNRQHYGFKRYSYELMTTCALLSREKDYHGWTQYRFPQLLKKLSASRSTRQTRLSISKKIGKQVNSSARAVMKYELPLIQELFNDREKAALLTAQFEFDEKEVAFLLNTKPETKKVQRTLEEATKIREAAMQKKHSGPVQLWGKNQERKEENRLFPPNSAPRAKKKPVKKEVQPAHSGSAPRTGKKPAKKKNESGKQTTLFG